MKTILKDRFGTTVNFDNASIEDVKIRVERCIQLGIDTIYGIFLSVKDVEYKMALYENRDTALGAVEFLKESIRDFIFSDKE